MIRLTTHAGQKGTFAIDDIRVRPGSCNNLNDYVYTFDSMDDLELLLLQPLDTHMGTIIDTKEGVTYPYAPRNDHTTGDGSYFLFMNPKDNTLIADFVNWLVIDNLPPMDYYGDESRCVRFAFQVYGNATLGVGYASIESNSVYYKFKTSS